MDVIFIWSNESEEYVCKYKQLGQHEIILKKKKGIKLTRTKSIKKIYSIKLLRNKKDSSKIIFKLEMIGETTDKYDFQDYKDIFFEQPISTDDLIDSFKCTPFPSAYEKSYSPYHRGGYREYWTTFIASKKKYPFKH